jgi:hypothetical protein
MKGKSMKSKMKLETGNGQKCRWWYCMRRRKKKKSSMKIAFRASIKASTSADD